MAAINKALGGMPMVMHNRQWSPSSDYIRNLAFAWRKGPRWAVPADPRAFFTWFFQQQHGWGLTMYEQARCARCMRAARMRAARMRAACMRAVYCGRACG